MPPGHYMVFILDANGVPSTAAIIRMGTDAELEPPANQLPVADFTSSCSGLTCAFTDRSFDPDGSVTGWSWTFGDGGTSTARSPSRTYVSAGNYAVALTVTDDGGATQQRTVSVTVGSTSHAERDREDGRHEAVHDAHTGAARPGRPSTSIATGHSSRTS